MSNNASITKDAAMTPKEIIGKFDVMLCQLSLQLFESILNCWQKGWTRIKI